MCGDFEGSYSQLETKLHARGDGLMNKTQF